MIVLKQAKGKSYGVCGMGKSGRSAAKALLASGANVWFWDDNPKANAAAQKEFAAAQCGPPEQWPWKELAALVMSPGVPLDYPKLHPAVAKAQGNNVPMLGDVALLYATQNAARYVGITGTNGKSTTTTLIGHILQRCGRRVEVGGNLGTPALDLAPLGAEGIYVLELSSYQLELMGPAKMNVAVLLNITPDHIDHHGSMEKYIAAKKHIFDRQGKKDAAVVGIDDAASEAVCRELIAAKQTCVVPISAKQKIGGGVYTKDGVLHNSFMLTEQEGKLTGIASLQGEHNGQNAAAAYAACLLLGCEHEKIMAAMRSFPGLAHRMQYLGAVGGVTFVNDSKATNADAAEQALRTYDNIYWIAGGVAKEGGIEPLARYFPKIRHAYLIGQAAPQFAETLGSATKVSMSETLEKAFAAAAADAAKTKGVVLLAPACASFDQFANFEVRGEAFVKLVDGWKKEHAA